LIIIPFPDRRDGFLKRELPLPFEGDLPDSQLAEGIAKTSIFGEAEADIERW
jgi:hypothetical protein